MVHDIKWNLIQPLKEIDKNMKKEEKLSHISSLVSA